MNILFHYYFGGVCTGGGHANLAILVKTLCKLFPEDTYFVVCSASSSFAEWDECDNLKVLPIKTRFSTEVTRYRLATTEIGRLARKNNVDVIWSINLGPYYRTGVPQVLGIHNAYLVYPRSVTRYHPGSHLRVAALRYFFRKSLANADGAIAQTPVMARCVRQMKRSPSKIAVAPKAVESAMEVTPMPLPKEAVQAFEGGLGRDSFTFFYAASGFQHKNHAVLVSALEILRSQDENVRVAVTIPEDALVSLTGERVRSLVESGHIVPLGNVHKQYLRSAYDACDACVMPSVLESLSSAHLEAMQWCKPQVSADLPYARDLCGDATLYAGSDSASDWASRMREIKNDNELRSRLVDAGSRRMESFPQTWSDAARYVRGFLLGVVKAHRLASSA